MSAAYHPFSGESRDEHERTNQARNMQRIMGAQQQQQLAQIRRMEQKQPLQQPQPQGHTHGQGQGQGNGSASTPDSPSESVACRICGDDDDPHLLIAPCSCSGSLLKVHTTCLQRWITSRPGQIENEEADEQHHRGMARTQQGDGRMSCEVCHSQYRITLRYEFVWSRQRCCTWASIGHCLEVVVLLIMLAVCFSLYPVLAKRNADDSQRAFGSGEADSILIPIISVVMGLLTLVTLYKVFLRWKKANSILSIDATPQPNTNNNSNNTVNTIRIENVRVQGNEIQMEDRDGEQDRRTITRTYRASSSSVAAPSHHNNNNNDMSTSMLLDQDAPV